MTTTRAAICAAVMLGAAAADAFYLPNVEPEAYKDGAPVELKVNALRSAQEFVPFDYYKLPFCRPEAIADKAESLGEVLMGDDIQTSPYKVNMKRDVGCKVLRCDGGAKQRLRAELPKLMEFIENGYRGHLSIDSLPGYNNGTSVLFGRCKGTAPIAGSDRWQRGYALGVAKWCVGETLLNNHLRFNIKYHAPTGTTDQFRVVGFTIQPFSIAHNDDLGDCNENFDPLSAADSKTPLVLDGKMDNATIDKIKFTFSVKWSEAPLVSWATRWDAYLNSSYADSDMRNHWVYIINSLLIAVCLSVIATMILMRTLHKDFNTYNATNDDPDAAQEEMGWKLVHSDVFRPPKHSAAMCVVAGTGVQLLFMMVGALIFAVLGFLSPASRGTLLSTLILLFILMSVMAGYVCGLLLKMFDNKEWKVIFACAFGAPGVLFAAWFMVNLFNWHAGASDAVPFLVLLQLFAMWMLCGMPLVVLGAAFAFRQDVMTNPCRVGKLAREVPDQRWYLSAPLIYLLPATVPFGCVFLELKFIFQAMWQGLVYYVFGILAIVFVVWVITIALTTVVVLYYQLCYENYRWWWRSFIIPSAFGLHLFLYAVYYYTYTLNVKSKTGTLLYFTYCTMLCGAYALSAGTVGFLAAFAFIRKIYGSIKID